MPYIINAVNFTGLLRKFIKFKKNLAFASVTALSKTVCWRNNDMNLIFITVDGARLDRIVRGKHYQELIKKSSFFPKAIAYAPYTIAAMHAVFSGAYGNRNGVNSYWSSSKFKKSQFKTLTSYLHDAGYATYGDIINDLVIPEIGFDKLLVHDELHDNLLERHKDLLEKASPLKKQGKKFFLYLHYSNIHTGIMQEVLRKYGNFSTEYFSKRDKNEEFYDQLFEKADIYLGKIIEHCRILGLTEDAIIVVISDHGISVGEKLGERAYGVYCYDYTLISTALFYHKSLPKIQVNTQVRSVDILPTILDLLSIPIDASYQPFDGKSLVPLMHGKKELRIAFSQSGNPLKNKDPPKEPNVWAVRTDDWKFIKNVHNGAEEMYDLKNDPQEENNVIGKYPEKADELRIALDRISKKGLMQTNSAVD